jgi:hypothetical protein
MEGKVRNRKRYVHAEGAQTVRVSDRHYQAIARLAIAEGRTIRAQLERILDAEMSVSPRYEERA